jgi:hypothetical protein
MLEGVFVDRGHLRGGIEAISVRFPGGNLSIDSIPAMSADGKFKSCFIGFSFDLSLNLFLFPLLVCKPQASFQFAYQSSDASKLQVVYGHGNLR